MGNGEAASLAVAIESNYILASNNLSDIMMYVNEYDLEHMTTAHTLKSMYLQNSQTFEWCETLWSKMLQKQRKLPCTTFEAFMKKTEVDYL